MPKVIKRLQAVLALATLAMGPLVAQCVMCNRTAAAQQAARAAALNHGILVLLVPPLAILGGILWLAKRR